MNLCVRTPGAMRVPFMLRTSGPDAGMISRSLSRKIRGMCTVLTPFSVLVGPCSVPALVGTMESSTVTAPVSGSTSSTSRATASPRLRPQPRITSTAVSTSDPLKCSM